MLEKLIRTLEDTVDDIGYIIKRSAAFVVGKGTGQVAGLMAGGAIGAIAGGGETIGNVLAVGAVAGVSGAMTQMDYKHEQGQLLERYREELASLLGKAPDKVQAADLELAARGDFKRGIPANPTIRAELKNNWLTRNVNFVLASVVSAVTYLAVHAIDASFGGGDGALFSGVQDILLNDGQAFLNSLQEGGQPIYDFTKDKLPGLATVVSEAMWHGKTELLTQTATALAKTGLIGLVTYHGIKTPAHWLASEVLNIDEHTVDDRITDIKRTLGHGKTVQPEQVLGTFIHAHHDIEEQLAAEYGKVFDAMDAQEKSKMMETVQPYIDIAQITDDINKGRMRPEELAFAAHGQRSGIEVASDGQHVHHGNILDGMWSGLKALTQGWQAPMDAADHDKAQMLSESLASQLPGQTTVQVHSKGADHAHMHVENNHETPHEKHSFVAKVSRDKTPGADGLSHVERLKESSHSSSVALPT